MASPGFSPDPQQGNQPQPERGTWRWPWEKSKASLAENLAKQFDGQRGMNPEFNYFYRPTKPTDAEQGLPTHDKLDHYGGSVTLNADGSYMFRDAFGQEHMKYSDVAVYLSPTTFRPRRLVVQSADYVLQNRLSAGGDWRRTAMNADVATALRLAEWALRPCPRSRIWSLIICPAKLVSASLAIQVLLALPLTSSWNDDPIAEKYTDFPGYHWQWPKHTINPLDKSPNSIIKAADSETRPSNRTRIIRPRKLYVLQPDGNWKVVDNPPNNLQYVFISYAAGSFRVGDDKGHDLVRAMAREATLRANCTACWMDTDCIDQNNGYQKDADIYRMCDVIRGSKKVVVILPDDRAETRKFWGSRMWTLPEALLGPGLMIDFLSRDGDRYRERTLSLVEMTGEIWDDREYSEVSGTPTRLLAEHFAGELTLSRIELFVTAVEACYYRSKRSMHYTMFTPNDVTLAVMGLLHHRLDRDDDDTAFQSLARLSLANDSDRITERMVSLLHLGDRTNAALNPFYSLSRPDVFSTRLWDVQPTCYVVGVAHEDNTLILDSCRAMHIRWKGFPRVSVVRDSGWAKVFATLLVTAGGWLFFQGLFVAVFYAPIIANAGGQGGDGLRDSLAWAIAAFFLGAVLASLFGPVSVRRLYGGQVLRSSSALVGFEGVMPIEALERLVFGSHLGRLTYEPSSTPYGVGWRDGVLRQGREPDWVRDGRPDAVPLPEGHRLFTLVDTGEMTVSIFSAERPPTVALLCGREGGMLRAVLCSWDFRNNCLFKETVIRMPTSVWEAANDQGWLKVCLATMNQQRNMEREKERDRKEKMEKKRMEEEYGKDATVNAII
ncbi:putative 3-hydroxyisobutyrate dehydrogenase protein [Rosellinia necatrix]|uniref:Putative 3-hydroxyisobutyrate dehydrogenase protein n=1 Tax=Rosellinia necatrix TaxID=77044 RepID=A0A1W2TTS9_ROSNE|nr:putative 3-hydroxyisobutyrate dehydrogenase protein [Rosellinia necatrix]